MGFLKKILGKQSKSSKECPKIGKESVSETEKQVSTARVREDERIAVVRAHLEAINNRDLKEAERYVTADFVTLFKEFEVEFRDYAVEVQNILDSFPDFKLTLTGDNPIKLREDGVVTAEIIPKGHHTGKPYSFGPCEPIDPKGTYVENAPETIYMHFRDGKICKQVVVAHGEMTGPPGIHTQLGGFPLL